MSVSRAFLQQQNPTLHRVHTGKIREDLVPVSFCPARARASQNFENAEFAGPKAKSMFHRQFIFRALIRVSFILGVVFHHMSNRASFILSVALQLRRKT